MLVTVKYSEITRGYLASSEDSTKMPCGSGQTKADAVADYKKILSAYGVEHSGLVAIEEVKQPTQTAAGPLADFMAILPSRYFEGDLFQIEGTQIFLKYYRSGKSKVDSLGIKMFRPVANSLIGAYSETRLQANGKVRKMSGTAQFNF